MTIQSNYVLTFSQDGYMTGNQISLANEVLMDLLDELRCVSSLISRYLAIISRN